MRKRISKLVNKWTVGVLAVMLVAMFFAVSAKAETTGTYGILTYRIWAYKNEAEIIDCDEAASGEVIIPEEIEGYPVKTIYYQAFENCSEITNIIIPKSVTSICASAFRECSGLTSIDIPEGVTSIGSSAFQGCSGLTSIDIPEGVTNIESFAFAGCSGLTSVTIPKSITSMESYAFDDCTNLQDVYISDLKAWCNVSVAESSGKTSPMCYAKNIYLNNELLLGDIEIPKGTTRIGAFAFNNQSNITSITMSTGVTSIGSSSFRGCSSLMSIAIPEGVTSIGASAFRECSGLTSIAIPEGVTSIGASAFQECSGLTSIAIPEGVTIINSYTFSNCSSLTSIVIPKSVASIGDSAFSYCSGLTSIAIPEGVTIINSYTFSNCSSLTSIVIPKSVTCMEYFAFSYCGKLQDVYISDLKAWCNIDVENSSGTPLLHATNLYLNNMLLSGDVEIPEGTTQISDYAFYNQSNITGIKIPSSVKRIGEAPFAGCDNLRNVYISDLKAWCQIEDDSEHSGMSGLLGKGRKLYLNNKLLSGDVEIPEGTTQISAYAFYNQSSITSIILPDSVSSIEKGAFRDCSQLASIKIPSGVTTIGSGAFYGCENLTIVLSSAYAKQYAIDNNISYVVLPESISITTLPNKKEYCLHEELNLDGLVITATLYDDTSEIIQKGYVVSGFDSSKSSVQTIVISYGEKQVSFNVTVHDRHEYDNNLDVICNRCGYERLVTKVEIETEPTKKQYCLNNELDLGSLVLKVCYSDETTKYIRSGFEVSGFDSTKAGTCNVTISYGGKTATYAVTIQETHSYDNDEDDSCNVCGYNRVVEKVEIQTMPSKTVYCLNKELDLTSLVLKVYYSDGTTKDISKGFTAKGFNSSVAGNCDVELSYEGKTTSYSVTINEKHTYSDDTDLSCNHCDYQRAVDRIEIQTMPSKIEYCPDEELDLTNLVVKAYYGDGTVRDITTGFDVSGFDSTKAGICEVAITYGDKTVSYNVTIRAEHSYDNNVDSNCNKCKHERSIERIEIKTMPSKTVYCLNKDLDLTALVVRICYSDGTTKDITEGFEVSGFDSTKAGTCDVVISYEGKTTSYAVTINEQHNYDDSADMGCNTCDYKCVVSSIELKTKPSKLTYRQDEQLDLTGLVINAYCDDGSVREITSDFEVSGFNSTQAGEYTVVVKYEGYAISYTVVVEKYVATEITLNKTTATAYVGENIQLTATCTPNLPSAEKVVWSSSDENIATVDQNGNVTTIAGGTVAITASAGGIQVTCTITVVEGEWVKDSKGYWYKQYDGSYPHSEWKVIDGNKYYFDASGYRAVGWAAISGQWYYFNADGLLVKNQWIGVYYTDENGMMMTNAWVDNGKYYVDASGAYVATTGWFQLNGKCYYLSGGLKQTGWVSSGGVWYFMNTTTGVMLANEWLDDTYYFQASGAMATGWFVVNGDYYYFDGNGAKVTSRWIGNYYLKDSGIMATNEVIDGYYVGADGATVNGWKMIDGEYYYFSGGLKTYGWLNDGGTWYYMDTKTGAMYASQWLDNTYYFQASGAMAVGWTVLNGNYYYFGGSGAKVANSWVGSYYMKANGIMATSEWVDNNLYYVDASGAYVATTGWFQLNGAYYYLIGGAKQVGWLQSGGTWYYLSPSTGVMYANKWLDNTYYFHASGAMAVGWTTIDGYDYYFNGSGAKLTSQWIGDYYVDSEGKWLVDYPKSINIGTCPSLDVGDTYTVTTTLKPSNADAKYVVWTSSNESVATVENGVITAVAPGAATITATVNGVSDTCTVRVKEISVTSVTLDITSKQLYLGESFTLHATVNPSNATYDGITWTSSDESIATVENGVVTAISQGTVTITAKAGTRKSTCTVLVKEHPYSLGQTWKVDGKWRFTINSVEKHYKCNSYSSATGEQVITIHYTYYNDGYIGGTVQPELYFSVLNFKVYDENGASASIYSCTHNENPKELDIGYYCTASVSYILPSSSDNITIDVKHSKGNSAIDLQATYNVVMPYANITGVSRVEMVKPGTILQAGADTNYPNNVSWSSDKPSVATVDNNGKIVAKAPGFAIITLSAGGASQEMMVQVSAFEVKLETALYTTTAEIRLTVTNVTDQDAIFYGGTAGVRTSVDTYPLYNLNGVNSGTVTVEANSTKTLVLRFDSNYATGRYFELDGESMITMDFKWNDTKYGMIYNTDGTYLETTY